MAQIIRVPELGIAIANITIIEWLVEEGETISRGQPLLNVETDKIVMEVPCEASGVLLKKLFQQDAQLKIGAPIAIVGKAGESINALMAEIDTELKAVTQEPSKQMVASVETAIPHFAPPPVLPARSLSGKVLASPLAKRIAREMEIDLALVTPSSNDGKINKEDVLLFAKTRSVEIADTQKEPSKPAPRKITPLPDSKFSDAEIEIIPLRGIRKTIADNMVKAVQTAAHYSMGIDVDCTHLVAMRNRLRNHFSQNHGLNLTYVPFVVKAMAQAVKDHPIVNAMIRDKEIVIQKTAHIGVAVAYGDFIYVPVIRRPIDRTLLSIAQELEELVQQVRAEKITLDKLQGGTITLTNMGAEVNTYPGLSIVNPPEVTSVAMGRVNEQVVPVNGKLQIKPILKLSFSYDHRVVMGIPGGRFADRVKYYLENPDLLLAA